MHFSMVAIGSTGDVRPYILLGQELHRRGHQARILAFSSFEKNVTEAGLDFFPLPGNLEEYMKRLMKPGNSALSYIPQLQKMMSGCKNELMDAFVEGCTGTDAILSTFTLSAVALVAEKLKLPYIQTYYIPMDANGTFPLPVFPQFPGKMYAEASYRVSWLAINAFQKMMLDDWTDTQGIGETEIRSSSEMTVNGHRVPVIYALSPTIVPRPAEWDENIYMTGFWQGIGEPKPLSPEIEAFLQAGEKPVYIGFGSMVSGDMEKTFRIVNEALKLTGMRAFVDGCVSSDKLPAERLPYVYYNTGFVDHRALFPQMRAVVHHGGAGTTASGLAASRPTLVIPFCDEQAFWGHRVEQQGAGPKPISRTLLTSTHLAESLYDLYCNARYADNAARLGQQLRSENGLLNAADLIEKLLANW